MRGRQNGTGKKEDSYTTPLEVRLKPTTLAEVCSWLQKEGMMPSTKSGVVRVALETFAEMLVSAKKAERCRYTEDALDYLDSIGISGYGRYGQISRRLHSQLNEESAMRFTNMRQESAPPEGLLDANGWILHSTMVRLAELGYTDTCDVDNRGNGLPAGVMDILRRGELPPRIEKLAEVLNKVETPEEATARRAREQQMEKAAMRAAIEARQREKENENI